MTTNDLPTFTPERADATRAYVRSWIAEHCGPIDPEAVEAYLHEMAPFVVGGWVPSEEQRRTAEHFGATGDVFDVLGIGAGRIA